MDFCAPSTLASGSFTGEVVITEVGQCAVDPEEGGSSGAYVAIIAVFHLMLLLWGNFILYKTRAVFSEFNESKYVAFAMVSSVEVLLLGVPLATC